MNQFVFKDYFFDEATKTATFSYGFDDGREFTETYRFDFAFVDYNPAALDRALQTLFFMAGISYYKAFLPPEIIIKKGQMTSQLAAFLETTYQKGLGELLYKNNLDPRLPITFPINAETLPTVKMNSRGILVSIGGGKDSLLASELLKTADKIATWSLGHRKQLEPLIDKIGLEHFWVERRLDPEIIKLAKSAKGYNGHIPISAIFACTGTVVSVLSGYKDSVVSNEQSANESTLSYKGVAVNHQYSKSSDFERDFQQLMASQFGGSLRYYSLLRPLREIAILREFAKHYLDKYAGLFSSCNRAFTQDSQTTYWCGECPKCAGIYLLMAPFIAQNKLDSIFPDNLLLKPELETTYRQLLGTTGSKPLECVGEIAENRWTMSRAKNKYPELSKYDYEEARDEMVWSLSLHDIPQDVIEAFGLEAKFKSLAKFELLDKA